MVLVRGDELPFDGIEHKHQQCSVGGMKHVLRPLPVCAQLVIDLGGIHSSETGRYNLSALSLGVGTAFTIVRSAACLCNCNYSGYFLTCCDACSS